jgi:hypothetical protein
MCENSSCKDLKHGHRPTIPKIHMQPFRHGNLLRHQAYVNLCLSVTVNQTKDVSKFGLHFAVHSNHQLMKTMNLVYENWVSFKWKHRINAITCNLHWIDFLFNWIRFRFNWIEFKVLTPIQIHWIELKYIELHSNSIEFQFYSIQQLNLIMIQLKTYETEIGGEYWKSVCE